MNDRTGSTTAELVSITDGAAAAADAASAQGDTTIRRMRLEDLTFYKYNANLRETPDATHGASWWNPTRSSEYWAENVNTGHGYFDQVAALARFDEVDAFRAIRYAITSSRWRVGGTGEEAGFAEAIARAAVVGLAALRAGWHPFDEREYVKTSDRGHVRAAGFADVETVLDTRGPDERVQSGTILTGEEHSQVWMDIDTADDVLTRAIGCGCDEADMLYAASALLQRAKSILGEP